MQMGAPSKLNPRARDYTGQVFGHLTVLGFSGKLTLGGNYIWECQCDCGKYKLVSGGNLKRAVSCGCFRSTSILPNRESKKCSKCGNEKKISEFGKNKSRKDGHSQFCKDCVKLLDVQYRPNQREWRANYQKLQRDTKIQFRIADNLRRRVNSSLHGKSKNSSTNKLIGCSIPELLAYLQSRFTQGMNLDNYGEVWEIDHIIPCARFDLSKTDEQLKCFHYTNLQPLLINENRKKNSWHGGVRYGY